MIAWDHNLAFGSRVAWRRPDPRAGQIPGGNPRGQTPEAAGRLTPAVPPGGGQVRGLGGRTNVLVQRFNENAEFAALYKASLAEPANKAATPAVPRQEILTRRAALLTEGRDGSRRRPRPVDADATKICELLHADLIRAQWRLPAWTTTPSTRRAPTSGRDRVTTPRRGARRPARSCVGLPCSTHARPAWRSTVASRIPPSIAFGMIEDVFGDVGRAPRATGTPCRTRPRPRRRPRRRGTGRSRSGPGGAWPRRAQRARLQPRRTSSTRSGCQPVVSRKYRGMSSSGMRHDLAELLGRRLGDPDVVARATSTSSARRRGPRAAAW